MAISAYEAERNARVQRNKEFLQELNLPSLVDAFNASFRRNNPKKLRHFATQAKPAVLEKRRSSRLANVEAPDYNEAVLDRADAQCARGPSFLRAEEVYTEQHVKALGEYKEEWVLFQDGYDAQGNRIYSKEAGLTCHQCRQKTIGLRTSCSSCKSLKGVFCGDCLFMRYGENVKEALANPQWTCPDCREICNCSIHRNRKGWAPTGTYYRQAIAQGYKSVAHYIVLNNLAKPVEPAAEPAKAAVAEPSKETTEAEPTAGASPQKEQRATRGRGQKQITDTLAADKLKRVSGRVEKKAAGKKVKGRALGAQAVGLVRTTRSMVKA